MRDITQQLETMNLSDIHTQEIVQLKADVVSNEKDQWKLAPYISDMAIDIVSIAPPKLKAFLLADDRKNMSMISIVAMGQQKAFAIGCPDVIAKFLLANGHTTIECEDGNVIQVTFNTASSGASGNKGSFFWCHITVGAFDPTTFADLKTPTTEHLATLNLEAVRFKPMHDKIAGTWLKKVHVDLKFKTENSSVRYNLHQTEFALPAGMKADISWGADMRRHLGLCMGPCSRVVMDADYEGGYTHPIKGNCQCKSKSGKSNFGERAKADALWARRMKKKTSPGAGPSSA